MLMHERTSIQNQLVRHYHDRLLREANPASLTALPPEQLRARVEALVGQMISEEGRLITQGERAAIIKSILDETIGFGPLERILADPTVTEIMVNGPGAIFVERNGILQSEPGVAFMNEDHVRHIIDRVVAPLGRRIDESSPMVDARLPDGSRVNAVVPPLSLNGPTMTIRRFRQRPFTIDDLVRNATLTEEMAEFLRACVGARLSILVSGGTGSGKTTLLNVLSSFIPSDERIITVEDAAELQFYKVHPHVLRMEARPPNLEGRGEIPIRQLVRGAETLDMLQAMNTGHEGSMTTVHANSPMDAFARLETMVLWAEGAAQLPLAAIRKQLASAIDIVVQENRMIGGERRIVSISEVQGMKHGDIILKDIFVYEQKGVSEVGRVYGDFTPTGVLPKALPRLKRYGSPIEPARFTPRYLESELGVELFSNPEITEIMVNGPSTIYIERNGKLERVPGLQFRDEQHLLNVINTIVAPLGRRIDESSPMVDARLPDGSRVNVVTDALSLEGPVLTIRRFRPAAFTGDELVERGAFSRPMLDFLRACVIARRNLLISGGTGSGKTTLLNALSSFIPDHERLMTIEDAAELRLQKSHVLRLEARQADQYGDGEVTIRQLVRNALRMRPDRIIVGEVRGAETLDMLQAMNTGHEGSMTTVHANSPADAFARLETMALFAEMGLTNGAVREQLASALEVVVQIGRQADGQRRCLEIAEVVGMEAGAVRVAPIWRWQQTGLRDGVVHGRFVATGYRPRCLDVLESYGVGVDPASFERAD